MNTRKYELTVSFKITNKLFFVKIEVCGKKVKFSKISKNTKENLISFQTDFIFALISRHFIGLSRYFRLLKVRPQIKEPLSNKFNKNSINHFFLQNIEFLLEFSAKFKKLNFYIEFSWIFSR